MNSVRSNDYVASSGFLHVHCCMYIVGIYSSLMTAWPGDYILYCGHLIFVGCQNDTCFMSPFWLLEFDTEPEVVGKICVYFFITYL